MRIKEIIELLDGDVIAGEESLDLEVSSAYSADLLSDVLALTEGDTLLITGTVTLQVIRVAEILGITAIIFIRGKQPSEDVMDVARKRLNIPMIVTRKTMFETSGILYKNGVRPCKNRPASEV
ncbi:MAG TPA: DRTGG domain-containing protein [Candidatus Mcinerneyibacteriales bacterium]|nr:DRTGG domain-containing protein [Candidatus Mcinerneyibacteriales bacterium]HPJ70503.1 DRTGG domain-containing protein [Candidatus Mcinerneyibacteriales bacterium]HPQ89790.1 DRTGG domain-containing protein [Candidatus Mcinerneyibacteriales bacterium]